MPSIKRKITRETKCLKRARDITFQVFNSTTDDGIKEVLQYACEAIVYAIAKQEDQLDRQKTSTN